MRALRAYREVPPLRASAFEPDDHDTKRVDLVKRRWHSQDAALLPRDRQIEENIRMLCGQHWTVWSDVLGRFIDVAQFLGEQDEVWRQRPTINVLLNWFTLTKARLTENPPIITFLPQSGDRSDAELAEVMDTLFKSKWDEAGMLEVIDRFFALLIPSGRGHLKSRLDPRRGPLLPWKGPAVLPVLGPDGHPLLGAEGPMEVQVEDCCFDRTGAPVTRAFLDEWGIGYHEPDGQTAHAERKGGLVVDVLSPLEVRGTWGEQTPWHQKQWHIHRSFMSAEDVFELWGLDVEPDIRGGSDGGPAELHRLMLGSGFFGAASANPIAAFGADDCQEWVTVYEMWERPGAFEGMEETLSSPGGRLTVIAGDKVARDGIRVAAFPYTSPIRTVDFANVPGRPSGTSPQEALNPLVRAANHSTGQILQHADHCANPRAFIHQSTGIDEAQWTDEPGAAYIVNTVPGVKPVEFAAPPALGEDAHRSQAFLFAMVEKLGNMEGAQGRPETRDPSGEVIRELRENSDRPISSTARAAVQEFARMVEDWMAWFRVSMDDEEIIAYAGEDEIVRTVTVRRELFEQGRVNVRPDLESMLPESRGERQARVRQMWQEGAFGDPASPEARSLYLEYARFPHLGREVRPGGVHRIMAQRELAQMILGTPASQIPVLEVYDHTVHLFVLEQYMAGPEFLKQPPTVQEQLWLHRAAHMQALEQQRAQMLAQQAAAAAMLNVVGDPNGGAAGAPPKVAAA